MSTRPSRIRVLATLPLVIILAPIILVVSSVCSAASEGWHTLRNEWRDARKFLLR